MVEENKQLGKEVELCLQNKINSFLDNPIIKEEKNRIFNDLLDFGEAQTSRKYEIFCELLKLNVDVSEPTNIDGKFIYSVDVGTCTDLESAIKLIEEYRRYE